MREAWSTHERWTYECQVCHTVWDEDFEIQHASDGHGGDAVVYRRNGLRSTTPWSERLCPGCGSQNVMTSMTPWGTREPVIRTRRPDDLDIVFKLRRVRAY